MRCFSSRTCRILGDVDLGPHAPTTPRRVRPTRWSVHRASIIHAPVAIALCSVAALAVHAQPRGARPSTGPRALVAISAARATVAPVTVGADRLFGEYAHLIRGKRLALVTNHSGRLGNGVHLADTLAHWPAAQLRVLFGMEYDIRSNDYARRRDGETAIDSATGLPKYNLYGESHRPTREQLGDAEVIIIDIQEVGARFYEHVNILGFVMDAAAEYGQTVVVLDRPNPLGGRHADGFVTDPSARYRFGSYTDIPALHAMTMGELARFYAGERLLASGRVPPLHVVPMRGWRRDDWFDDTGLAWRKPSPNLLSFSSLVAYAGTCLFEAVNVSEGRGTPTPFEVIGAPWMDHGAVLARLRAVALPGVRFDTTTVQPVQQPFHGRPPKYADQRIPAIRLTIVDRRVARPYRIGVTLLWAVHAVHREQLVWNDAVLSRLSATPRLKAMLEQGAMPDAIVAAWTPEVERFERRRAPYLLYR